MLVFFSRVVYVTYMRQILFVVAPVLVFVLFVRAIPRDKGY